MPICTSDLCLYICITTSFECDHVFRFMTSDSHSFLLHGKANALVVIAQQKKKRGRGRTELRKIYDRDQPKQRVELNEFGQPVGSNGKTFANFIGTGVGTEVWGGREGGSGEIARVYGWLFVGPSDQSHLGDF